MDAAAARRIPVRAGALFVAGFTTIFTSSGVAVTLLGAAFVRNEETIVRAFGVLIIVMRLATIGLVVRSPILYRERRYDLVRIPRGPGGAFAVGMAFAAGWAPCIGPVLATILATAASTSTVTWGGVLLAIYSLGLRIPFVLLALGVARMRRSADWLDATAEPSRSPADSCSSLSASSSSPADGSQCSDHCNLGSPSSVGRRHER